MFNGKNIILLDWENYPHSVNLVQAEFFQWTQFLLYSVHLQKVLSRITVHVQISSGFPVPRCFTLLLHWFIVIGIYPLNSLRFSFLFGQEPMHITLRPPYPDYKTLQIYTYAPYISVTLLDSTIEFWSTVM